MLCCLYLLFKKRYFIFNMYELRVFVFVSIDSCTIKTLPITKDIMQKEKVPVD